MAHYMVRLGVVLIILLIAIVAEGAPQPKAKKVKCQDKKFYKCYHKDLYCPKACLRTCVVDCKKCKAVCKAPPPPPPPRHPPPPPPKIYHHSPPPPPKTYPSPPPAHSVVPSSPPPPLPSTSTPSPSPSPTPTPTPTPSPPLPSTPTPSPPPPVTPTPSPPLPPTFIPSSSYPPPPPPSSEASGEKRVKCKNKNYTHCYGLELSCPSGCPEQCEVDCVTCSPVCSKYTKPTFVIYSIINSALIFLVSCISHQYCAQS